MHGAATAVMSVEVNVNVSRAGITSYVPEWAWDKVSEGQTQAVGLVKVGTGFIWLACQWLSPCITWRI